MANYVYYNAPSVCIKDNVADIDLKAVFNDETVEPIIKNASNYEFAVARYDMKAPTIPCLEVNVVPNQGNVNLLTYGIRIFGTIGGGAVDSNMINFVYLPRNNRADQQGYYFIYNYDHFCDMMNVCFASCVTAITSTAKAPKMSYSPTTNLFTIYTDSTAYDLTNNGNGEQLQIQFNQELFNLLRHFNYLYNADNSSNLIVVNKITNTVVSSGVTYIVNQQTYPSTGFWSPVGTIVFKSDSMQMNNEIIGNTSVLTSSISSLGNTKSNLEQNSITDILINLNSSMDYNSNITYVPTQYRWLDLYKMINLDRISFSVYWRHKNDYNRVYPVLLPNGGTINVKMLFQKK